MLTTHLCYHAMDLKAAANRRLHAQRLGPAERQMRSRLIENAKFLILEARHCRLQAEAAAKVDTLRAYAAKHEAGGEPIIAAHFCAAADTAERRAASMPHPAFR